ncbi:hypothetical protein ACOSQ4_021349 [Xanthoceras sorbifolium]
MNVVLHRLDIIDERSSRELGRVTRGGCCFPIRREGIGDSDEDEEEVQMGGVRPRETRNVQRQPREARGNVLDELKLKGLARVWWSCIEERLRRTRQAPITEWEDMKEKLETKYLPINYEQLVYEDMLLWSQGTKLSVDQYTERFHELTVRMKGCNATSVRVLDTLQWSAQLEIKG